MDFKLINELAKEVHKNAVVKGFCENTPSEEHFLCLVVSELMEAVEADRKCNHADMDFFNRVMSVYIPEIGSEELYFKRCFDEYVKDTVEDELSDAFIRLLDLAGAKEYVLEGGFIFNEVASENSFTENIYLITQGTVCGSYSVTGRIQYPILNIMKLAEIIGFNLEWHVRQKMRYNALREYKHGKAY